MDGKTIAPSIQEFSLVRGYVSDVTKDLGLSTDNLGFVYFALDMILSLQDDEISDAITDTAYLKQTGKASGPDRGIDAVYVDGSQKPPVVHFFNCKYTTEFTNITNHFPGTEIDKILSFLAALMSKDEKLSESVNNFLYSKVEEIWDLFNSQNPKFVVHIVSNSYQGFEETAKRRFERDVRKYSDFSIEYHLMPYFVQALMKQGKQTVDARLKAIDLNLFEKSDGDIRALVVDIDARELLRIVMSDETLRDDVDVKDYSVMKSMSIMDDAFEDNVRVYLKQRTRINQNIKYTALSEDAYRFFYYNNGITITCSHFAYPKMVRNPIVELEDLQIVNGSQTIHALFDAFKENQQTFERMDVLCRIYETTKEELSTHIAEFTNSQNPVKSRDIRSNDFIQKKLEKELEVLGYFYERKKGKYTGKPRSKRIDAEKAGQALLAFYNKMPAEAKNDKKLVFAEKYDDIFNDQITADSIITATSLFNEIEKRKAERKAAMVAKPSLFARDSFLLYASYYVLYTISILADQRGIAKNRSCLPQLIALYEPAVKAIRKAIQSERSGLGKGAYSPVVFFKTGRPLVHLQKIFESEPGA